MDLEKDELHHIIQRAIALKNSPMLHNDSLQHKTLAMVFEKSSTRTRVAFEVAMTQLGGNSIFLASGDTQLGRGEPVEDTARVISRMVDFITIRTFEHSKLELFAKHSLVPVINALSDDYHPCQLLADMQTYYEHRGSIENKIACPEGFDPEPALLEARSAHVRIVRDPHEAVRDADLVTTDVWASMGQEEERKKRLQIFADYQVDEEMMALAKPDALFFHCLPAHRGEEVSAAVLDAPNSVVWEEAENRLHTKKALLEFLCQK